MTQQVTVSATALLERGDEFFLSDQPHLTSLRITDAVGLIESLAQLPLLSRLRTLALGGNWFAPAEAKALAESPHLSNLENLTMHNCSLGDEGLREFALASNLNNLRVWFLTDNGLTDRGLTTLGNSTRFSKLESLCLGNYGVSVMRHDTISRQALETLADSSRLTNLSAIHWYELTDRRDAPCDTTTEELARGVRLMTHVEQIW
jgi:hypothetical protein